MYKPQLNIIQAKEVNSVSQKQKVEVVAIRKKKNVFQRMHERFSNVPTMKKWGYLSWTAAAILTIILIYGVFKTDRDMDVYATIVGLAWGEVSVYSAVYAWKEKAANKLKITYNFLERLAGKYRIENVAPILESILQD